MTPRVGIDAPASVPAGTTSAIDVAAPGLDRVTVTVVGTGEVIEVKLDAEGNGRFELPTTALAGEALTIRDPSNPSTVVVVPVVPPSAVVSIY